MKKPIRLEDIKTVEQVAKELNVSEDTIKRWRQKGMPVISIDKYVRIWMPDALGWLVEQKEMLGPNDRPKDSAE